jgi:hypothetical protein
MLDKIHDHIVSELGHSSRTDTIFVVTAIVFNLIVLGINSGVSAAAVDTRDSFALDLVLVIFIVMSVLLNGIAVAALYLGRRTRRMLLDGLVDMYRDNDADKYYNPALLSNYGVRYLLFVGVIVILGITSIVVPLIIRFWAT